MRPAAVLAAVLAAALALAGCGDLVALRYDRVAHRTPALNSYVESFNRVLAPQLTDSLSVPLLTGSEASASVFGGTIGVGFARYGGVSETTFANGTLRTLDVRVRDTAIRNQFALLALVGGGGDVGPIAAPAVLTGGFDTIYRRTAVSVVQTPAGGVPNELLFEGTDVVFRPSVGLLLRGSLVAPAAGLVSLRADVGYDLALTGDALQTASFESLAAEYTAERGSTTFTGDAVSSGMSGLHARVGLSVGF